MWVDIEPGTPPMMRVMLCFNKDAPNQEDQRVRTYLKQYRLVPKQITEEEREGTPVEVLRYGECYLGPHMQRIQLFQQRGMVADVVDKDLHESPELSALIEGVDEERRLELTWSLAVKAIEAGAGTATAEDPSGFVLDQTFLRDQLVQAIDALREPTTATAEKS